MAELKLTEGLDIPNDVIMVNEAVVTLTYKRKDGNTYEKIFWPRIVSGVKSDAVTDLENRIIKNLENLKGNWPCDYSRNGIIDNCKTSVADTFKELYKDGNDDE